MLLTHEMLDRFEMLYPENSNLSDLRRAYVDKDLYSIFRLLPESVNGNLEDLRKAVIEKNLHSIFRLVEDADLRKFLLEDNTYKLWPLLQRYVNTHFVSALKSLYVNNTVYDKDCFSRGQLSSKLWLIEELKKLDVDLGTVFLCAGWYATLATMIFESGMSVEKIRSFDIDDSCVDIAETFNQPWLKDQWRFKSITSDIMAINYNEHTWQYWSTANNRMSYPISDVPNTIINTSCEHINNFKSWYKKIPADKLVILQSNNYFEIPEHVNCSKSLKEFSKKAPMNHTLYEGELGLEKYTRFMKIGLK